jgi:hypothetical protein
MLKSSVIELIDLVVDERMTAKGATEAVGIERSRILLGEAGGDGPPASRDQAQGRGMFPLNLGTGNKDANRALLTSTHRRLGVGPEFPRRKPWRRPSSPEW